MTKKYKKLTAEEYEAEMRILASKPLLTRNEASEYFHIGLRHMDRQESNYKVMNGKKVLIDRNMFYEFLRKERRI